MFIRLFLFSVLALMPVHALALSTTYTDRTAFTAAAGASDAYTFETATLPDGIVALGSSAELAATDNVSGRFCFCQYGGSLTLMSAAPVLAVGFDLAHAEHAQIVDIMGQVRFVSVPQFYGIVFDTPTVFTMGQVSTGDLLIGTSSVFTIDNLAVVAPLMAQAKMVGAVPEPTTSLLMFGGIAGVLLWSRCARSA